MVIDIHTHAFPDKVAEKAIESLETDYQTKAFSDGTVSGLLSHMRKSGVDISIVLAVSTAARQVSSINTWIADLPQLNKKLAPDANALKNRIIGFGTIHPEFEDYRDEIKRMKEFGIKGVKFQPSFQRFYPDDERMFPVYEELIKAGIIILFHCGDEIEPVKGIYSTPDRIARMLDAMKNDIDNYNYRVQGTDTIKIVAAHFGGFRMWNEVEEHLLGRNIYFDASYVFGHMDSARILRFIKSHGANRILFGSDFPFADPKQEIRSTLQLDIDQMEKDAILAGNALRLLELS